MLQRSWFFRNGLYYSILVLVLLIHLILLAMRISRNFDVAENPVRPIKIDRPLKINFLPSSKQIVQSEDPTTSERPDKKSYLSDKNRKFNRESRARKIDIFHSSGKGQSFKPEIALSDLGAFGKGHNPLKKAAQTRRAGIKSGDDRKKGISSTNDYVEGVPLGDLTYLNTVEYKYYGFYQRIRQKLEQFWGRSIQEKAVAIMKQGRRVATGENLITSLEVTMNDLGKVVGIVIRGTSGLKELDDAAVDSFNEAGPFPNPPKGLIRNGLVRIAWGFVVNT